MIPAIVLAAGKSSRMGRAKAMLPVADGETFIGRIVRTFREAGIEDVVVVLGHDADAIGDGMERNGIRARRVVNAGYEQGQFSSFLTGLRAVDRPDTEALLLTLVDVPLVSPSTVMAVVARYREIGAPIVRPVRGALHGHPVLVARQLFEVLKSADPAHGAKPIVRAFASAAGDVMIDDEGAFRDVDTPDDYERLVRRFPS